MLTRYMIRALNQALAVILIVGGVLIVLVVR